MLSFTTQVITHQLPTINTLILPEHCPNSDVLKTKMTDKKYTTIVLNDNALDDDALLALSTLSYLQKLHIAQLHITGSCLSEIIKITGLEYLNIACNPLLNAECTAEIFSNNLLNTKITHLDLSGNKFDFNSLELIFSAVARCSIFRKFTLILTSIELSQTELNTLELKTMEEYIDKLQKTFSNLSLLFHGFVSNEDRTINQCIK